MKNEIFFATHFVKMSFGGKFFIFKAKLSNSVGSQNAMKSGAVRGFLLDNEYGVFSRAFQNIKVIDGIFLRQGRIPKTIIVIDFSEVS